MRNPLKRREKALTATPEVVGNIRDGWTPWPLLGGGARERILSAYNAAQSANYAWTYAHSPALRTVVDVIVRNVGQLDLRLYEEVSEAERKPRPEHAAALSMRYPNETNTADAFIRSMFKDFLLFNNAYALIAPAPGGQLSFERIPAHMVEVQGNNLFRAENYRYWRQEGSWVDFAPDQIMHWHGENPQDPRFGVSLLDTLRAVLAEDAALQQATIELASSGLQEPTWVFRPLDAPDWSNQARAGFEEDINNRLRHATTKPVVMEEGMEMRSFGVSPRDAQMFEVRRWAIERVASVYGVPLGMVGLRDNLKDAQSEFYADVLPPYCEEYTKMLNQRILIRVYGWRDGSFEFNLDEKFMGDDRLTSFVSATGRAVMLTNEARAKMNLPPVKGGDELVTPMNVIIGENPKPSPQVMGPQNPNGTPQDGSGRPLPKPGSNTAAAAAGTPKVPAKATEDGGADDHDHDDGMQTAVKSLLDGLYGRQERVWANTKRFSSPRFVRELAADLAAMAPGVDRKAAEAVAGGINEALEQALLEAGDSWRDVFKHAHANSSRLASVLVTVLGMDIKALQDLNVPDEYVWERAGIPQDQIDQMRAMQLSRSMVDDASDPAGA